MESVTTCVRSTVTPSSSRPKFSTLPTMPTAKMARSASMVSVLPPLSMVAVTVVAPGFKPFTDAPVIKRMPRFWNALAAKPEISASSTGKIRSSASTTVTSEPSERKKLANSIPIAPEPITNKRFGMVSGTSASRYVQISLPSGTRPAAGMVRARAPVAKMTCLAVMVRVPPAARSTVTPGASVPLVRRAVPAITSILFFFIR